MSTVLTIQNLVKNYGSITAVNNLNLEIEAGQIFGLLGPNGSGKTTTLAIILSILKYDSGSYEWFGGKYGKREREEIGAILETPNFYPYLNATENLDIIAHIKKAENVPIDDLLEMVDLLPRKKSNFNTYSLGMKQRLAIAAALVGDPEVLIFDEPTNGLDPQGIAEVREIILKIANMGKTVIMSSHILAEIEKVCSHVGILKQGKLLATGTVGSIIDSDVSVEILADDKAALKALLNEIFFIKSIEDTGKFFVVNMEDSYSAGDLNKIAVEKGIALTHLLERKKSLESEFLAITKND